MCMYDTVVFEKSQSNYLPGKMLCGELFSCQLWMQTGVPFRNQCLYIQRHMHVWNLYQLGLTLEG